MLHFSVAVVIGTGDVDHAVGLVADHLETEGIGVAVEVETEVAAETVAANLVQI